MFRRIFRVGVRICAAVSLLLCLATLVLWYRSFQSYDEVAWSTVSRERQAWGAELSSDSGSVTGSIHLPESAGLDQQLGFEPAGAAGRIQGGFFYGSRNVSPAQMLSLFITLSPSTDYAFRVSGRVKWGFGALNTLTTREFVGIDHRLAVMLPHWFVALLLAIWPAVWGGVLVASAEAGAAGAVRGVRI